MNASIGTAYSELRAAGYECWNVTDGATHSAMIFENPTVIGFVLSYASVAELVEMWREHSNTIVKEHQFALKRAGVKAWNTYLILLAESDADEVNQTLLDMIEEDLRGTRKIARAVGASVSNTREAMLPLLPLQHAPRLEAVDTKAEITLRATEIPSHLVEIFLSDAPESLVLQMLEEGS